MNFTLTEEQQLIQDTAKRFAENELAPVAQTLDETKDKSILLANCHKLAELGFMGLNIDGEYGGTEAGTIAFSVAMTEIARGCASTAVTMSVTNMVAEVIQAVGSEQQKAHYLPLICSGEYKAGSFCLTESGAGSDPASMSTQAEKTDKGYVINGTKQWITSAEFAGVFVVWAVTDANAAKGKGITCFLVDANSAGITVGPAEKKMGVHPSASRAFMSWPATRRPATSSMALSPP